MTGGGTNLSFHGNTLDTCCFESSDVGSFYVCGQGGSAFWGGRGGKVINNTFKNIRNIDGTGVQGPSVQALYAPLDLPFTHLQFFIKISPFLSNHKLMRLMLTSSDKDRLLLNP